MNVLSSTLSTRLLCPSASSQRCTSTVRVALPTACCTAAPGCIDSRGTLVTADASVLQVFSMLCNAMAKRPAAGESEDESPGGSPTYPTTTRSPSVRCGASAKTPKFAPIALIRSTRANRLPHAGVY